MKTKFLLLAGVICAILAVRTWAAPAVVADWLVELSVIQQTSHQDAGGAAFDQRFSLALLALLAAATKRHTQVIRVVDR